MDTNFHTITLSDCEFLVGLSLQEAENIIVNNYPDAIIRVVGEIWRADLRRNRINVKVDAEYRIISILGIH